MPYRDIVPEAIFPADIAKDIALTLPVVVFMPPPMIV
jgi:hypothetical protein